MFPTPEQEKIMLVDVNIAEAYGGSVLVKDLCFHVKALLAEIERLRADVERLKSKPSVREMVKQFSEHTTGDYE